MTISSAGAAGASYQLESSSNLSQWTTAATVTASAAGQLSATVSTTSGRAFYRYTYTSPPAP
jgi:hypothetical protein